MEEQTTNTQLASEVILTDDQMLVKIKQIKEKQAQAALLNEEIEKLKDQIKQEMTRRDLKKLSIDIFKVNYSIVESNRFNSAKFKKDHEDLYKSYCYISESRRFEIT